MSVVIAGILMTVGALWLLVAAIGLLRMPDLYLRLSTASKTSALGLSLMALAAAVYLGSLGGAARAAAVILFLFLTAPVAAHMIGRAAYFSGAPRWRGTLVDELRGPYELEKQAPKSDAK